MRRPVQLTRTLRAAADRWVVLLPVRVSRHYFLVDVDVLERVLYTYESFGSCAYTEFQKVRSCVHATPSGRVEARVAVEAHTPR